MTRIFPFALVAAFLLTTASASAQAKLTDPTSESPTFFGGFSLGVSLAYTSIGEEYSYSDSDEDGADAIGVGGSLYFGSVLGSFGTALPTELSLGYRGSADQFLTGLVDTGFIHRHELSLGLHIRRAVSISFGSGIASLHDQDGILPAATFHLDTRYVSRSGVSFSLPLNVSYFPSQGGESIIVAQTGLEIGWQSLNR